MEMRRPTLAELAGRHHQVLIVGGGIIGCGAARDAALRGLRVALVERDDFGAGTTSRSTRLIHGGLRYLQQYDFKLVREDLRERETLLRIASHLVRPLPFLVPMYRFSPFDRLQLRAGMLFYDLLSFDRGLPGHAFLTAAETLKAEPHLDAEGLQGAARYFDGQVEFPERLCLENALDAASQGALLRNHTELVSYVVNQGRVVGAELRDGLTGETATVYADCVLNATGAWLDRSLAPIRRGRPPLLRTTKGVHLVTPSLGSNAVVLFARADRRLFFVVPWFGLSLIGTTDTDEANPPDRVRAEPEDIDYLVGETRRAFPNSADVRPLYAMAGVRALVRKEGVHESEVSRQHAIRVQTQEGGPAGLVSVVGGKITGYRAIAEDAINHIRSLISAPTGRCITASRPLPGTPLDQQRLAAEIDPEGSALGLNAAQRAYLARQYGRRAAAVLQLASARPELAQRVSPDSPVIAAELLQAVRDEAALTLADVMLRRTPLGFAPSQGIPVAARVAELVGAELGWTQARRNTEVAQYSAHVAAAYGLVALAPC
jgi:glycerol-3-phosphate dehydrogenase